MNKKNIKSFIKVILGKQISYFLLAIINSYKSFILKRKILIFYDKKGFDNLTPEEQEVISFLKENDSNLFPYNFIKKYEDFRPEIILDKEKDLYYSFFENKKIYFKKSSTIKEAENIIKNLILVQDDDSTNQSFQ
jgi:hypothetical protein